jgi:hypothetical protein
MMKLAEAERRAEIEQVTGDIDWYLGKTPPTDNVTTKKNV